MKEGKDKKTCSFPKLPEGWSSYELNQLGEFSKGKGILKDQVITTGLPCIRYGEIYTTHHYIIKKFKSFISEDVAAESQEIKKGDILFAGSGETLEDIGKSVAYIGNEKAYAGGDVIILSTNEKVNATFLSYVLETDYVRSQKRIYGQGQSVVHIYPSNLAKIKIAAPIFKEQTAIANCLSTWDHAIEKTQALLDQKEKRKKWLMQMLLTGKKRLKGFEKEKWKECALEKVLINFQNGYAFSSNGYSKNGIPIITMGQIGLDGTFQYDCEKVNYWQLKDLSSLTNFIVQKGDLIIAMTDVTPDKNLIGRMSIVNVDGPLLLNQRVGLLRIDSEKINPYFLYAITGLKYWREYSRSHATLGVQANLSTHDIKKAPVRFPNLKEQNAISHFLIQIDYELKIISNKKNRLIQQKQGLMQVLLTGKKRLKIKN